MPSEETPLLDAENITAGRDAVYQRFPPRTKHAIVAMVSGCGLVPSKCPRSVIIILSSGNDMAFVMLNSVR
jgi:hypothetical protein